MNRLEAPATALFKKNERCSARTVVNVGGARSGKSFAVAQVLIMRATNKQGINVGVTRKTMPALKMTAYRLFTDLLKKYRLYDVKNHNRMEHFYALGKSRVQFFSLDDPEKIKSTEFNYIWMEEANEFTYKDYITLLTRLSAPKIDNCKNQIFLTLNPVSSSCWVARELLAKKDINVIKSTYKDNPFLDEEYVKTLLALKDMDENAYRVFTLGLWGENKNIVYDNYAFAEELPSEGEEIYGLDFGFNNPSVLVKIVIRDEGLYVKEILYETGLTNGGLIKKLREAVECPGSYIYADAAEPDRIKEIYDAGFNILPANKSVRAGIMSVKQKKLFITKDSANLIKEIQNYVWKTDLAGLTLEEPVKFADHALDALRYAVHTHFSREAFKPAISFL